MRRTLIVRYLCVLGLTVAAGVFGWDQLHLWSWSAFCVYVATLSSYIMLEEKNARSSSESVETRAVPELAGDWDYVVYHPSNLPSHSGRITIEQDRNGIRFGGYRWYVYCEEPSKAHRWFKRRWDTHWCGVDLDTKCLRFEYHIEEDSGGARGYCRIWLPKEMNRAKGAGPLEMRGEYARLPPYDASAKRKGGELVFRECQNPNENPKPVSGYELPGCPEQEDNRPVARRPSVAVPKRPV
jgi:hypothetical protein